VPVPCSVRTAMAIPAGREHRCGSIRTGTCLFLLLTQSRVQSPGAKLVYQAEGSSRARRRRLGARR